jgi:hypothetical protein
MTFAMIDLPSMKTLHSKLYQLEAQIVNHKQAEDTFVFSYLPRRRATRLLVQELSQCRAT